ncbi:MAG: PEP-CTERM sorting domain-containing protein [Sphingomonas sp.]|nr:PEP-CTERM sorting domain-containing protein [Sphingomonas sp.]
MPKNDSALNDSFGVGLGNGGLQKWVFANGSWSLAYTLSAGLNLVANTSASGVTGLFGLTGQVNGDTVELYATSFTKGETDQSYLYGITDSLSSRTFSSTARFTTLAAAPADSNFRGVAFAPTAVAAVPEPVTWAMLVMGFGGMAFAVRRREKMTARVRFF